MADLNDLLGRMTDLLANPLPPPLTEEQLVLPHAGCPVPEGDGYDCPGCTCHSNPPCTHCVDHYNNLGLPDA